MDDGKRSAQRSIIRASFPSLGVGDAVCLFAEVTVGDREMSSAFVEMAINSSHSLSRLEVDVPVKLSWRAWDGIDGNFYGYVSKIDYSSDGLVHLMCSGVEQFLKDSSLAATSYPSFAAAASEVLLHRGLAFCTTRESMDSLGESAGELSDWDFLKKIADRLGLSFHVRGGTLLALPMDMIYKVVDKPTLDVDIPDQSAIPNTATTSVVRSFKTVQSAVGRDGSLVGSSSMAMVPTSGGVAYVRSSGTRSSAFLPNNQYLSSRVGSASQVMDEQQVSDSVNRWKERAVLVMDGINSIMPLDSVRLTHAMNRVQTSWSVISIKHTIGSGDHTMELTLGREEGAASRSIQSRKPNDMRNTQWTLNTVGSREWDSRCVLRSVGGLSAGTHPRSTGYRWQSELVGAR